MRFQKPTNSLIEQTIKGSRLAKTSLFNNRKRSGRRIKSMLANGTSKQNSVCLHFYENNILGGINMAFPDPELSAWRTLQSHR